MRHIYFLELTPSEVIWEVSAFLQHALNRKISPKTEIPLDEDYFGIRFQCPIAAAEIRQLCALFPIPCEDHFIANLCDDDPEAPVFDISEGLIFDILRKRYCHGDPKSRVLLFHGNVFVEITGGDNDVS